MRAHKARCSTLPSHTSIARARDAGKTQAATENHALFAGWNARLRNIARRGSVTRVRDAGRQPPHETLGDRNACARRDRHARRTLIHGHNGAVALIEGRARALAYGKGEMRSNPGGYQRDADSRSWRLLAATLLVDDRANACLDMRDRAVPRRILSRNGGLRSWTTRSVFHRRSGRAQLREGIREQIAS